ncbi:MAG: hypothetical protein D4R79_14965 [Comamonadaceae bacterium]|nr:MAG: hypothetical protein D4R79_14965 [Comamonadaceae bacterium]
MIGMYSSHSQLYLLVLASITSLVFALPLLLVPLTWARLMQWKIPEDTDLAVYFGRCLGAFVVGVDLMGFLGAFYPQRQQAIFEVLYFVSISMIAVHVYGAWRRIQPMTETIEIAFYALLLLLTLLFQPLS